jgi:hypothetical protein
VATSQFFNGIWTKRALPGWLIALEPIAVRIYSYIDLASNIDWVHEKFPQLSAIGNIAAAHPIWTDLSAVAIGLSWIYLIGIRKASKSKSQRERKQVEFMQTYSALGEAYPRTEYIFKEGNELHGYFLSGEGLLSWDGQKTIRHFERIILPKPNGSYLHQLQTFNMESNPYLRAPDQIKATTRLALTGLLPVSKTPS